MKTEHEEKHDGDNAKNEQPSETQQSPEFDLSNFRTNSVALFESVNDEKQDK